MIVLEVILYLALYIIPPVVGIYLLGFMMLFFENRKASKI